MRCLILFPNTLFKIHEIDEKDMDIIIYEHPKFFTYFKYHKLKLIFHRATMKYYENAINKKWNVTYCNFNKELKLTKYKKIFIYDPTDHEIKKEFMSYAKKHKIEIEILDSKLFILNEIDINEYIKSTKKPYFNSTFYKWIRRKKNILMTGDKPVGNVWSYDKENRKSFLDSYQENDIKFITNKYVTEAVIYIEKHFDENVGETDLYLPITHKDAEKWLHSFFKEKLKNFGAYEDAFRKDVVIGYHSCISALLNIGLLEPMYVIDAALNYARKHKIPIASLEGFIRQIISWREYVRMLYIMEHSRFNSENFFNHKNKISKKWYDGSTGILPIDNLIHKILKYSYCHHIERLMVIGNFFLISMVAPKEVYKWFITMISIDAYEWVMEPNIYGMSQHSVGTLMMTRPYFSSSNYLFNMSDYSKKEGYIDWDNDEIHWSEIWNALYYNFISNNKDYLKKIYSTANFVSFYNKKSKEEKNKIKKIAKTYMNDYL